MGDSLRMRNVGKMAFVVIIFSLCILPAIGLAWAPQTQLSDEESLASFPELADEEGSPNAYYLSGLGSYFEDHFAYRAEMIDLNARVTASLFGISSTAEVVVGSDGWLYYGATLPNYLGEDELSVREAKNIAHNLTIMQGYTNAQGADFVFTIAPNKNSLYPAHMPEFYVPTEADDMALLKEELDAAGVNYLDLFDLFRTQDEELYFKTDSHWTSEGALLAANALMEMTNRKKVTTYGTSVDEDYVGDIEVMLYPESHTPEGSTVFETDPWKYSNDASSVEDAVIMTESTAEGSLFMYRDSFGNALIPLLAPEFKEAYFSKMVPYNLTSILDVNPDLVVIERAERHANLFSEDPPFMPAPKTEVVADSTVSSDTFVKARADGDFTVIEGCVDEGVIDEESSIYVAVESAGERVVYVPFHMTTTRAELEGMEGPQSDRTTDYGFRLFLLDSAILEDGCTITIYVEDHDTGGIVAVLSEVV